MSRCGCASQQKQRDKEFAQHKARILANLGSNACDFSPKGSVDIKCHAIMDVLNTHTDYITTSSCSGRIALFHSVQGDVGQDGSSEGTEEQSAAAKLKRGGVKALGWLVVKHGVLLPKEMLRVVRYLCGEPDNEQDRTLDEEKLSYWSARVAGHENDEAYQGELQGTLFSDSAQDSTPQQPPSVGTVTLKMEPFVMHVECRTMESAKELLSAAVSDSGFRNSGVVPPGKKVMCGIRAASGLGMEVPLILAGRNYAQQGQRAYLWALLELANEKMMANEAKTQLLARSIAKHVASMAAAKAKDPQC